MSDPYHSKPASTCWQDWFYSEINSAVYAWMCGRSGGDLFTQANQYLRKKPREFWVALDSVIRLTEWGSEGAGKQDAIVNYLVQALRCWRPRKEPAASFGSGARSRGPIP